MPEITIQAGAKLFVPNAGEMRDAVRQAMIEDARERERIRAIKWLRAPLVLGTVASSAVAAGANHGYSSGPEQGYAWSITRLWVLGLSETSTPDIINIYSNGEFSNGNYLWQLNGNSNAATFGKGHIVLKGGETLNFQNVGSIAAAAGTVITLGANGWEVPEERLGELA